MKLVITGLIIAVVLIGLVYYFINNNKTHLPVQGEATQVIEANNSEEAAAKYLEEQLANITLNESELEQLLLSVQS